MCNWHLIIVCKIPMQILLLPQNQADDFPGLGVAVYIQEYLKLCSAKEAVTAASENE